jgi:MOSC domain-containing protein YiiM
MEAHLVSIALGKAQTYIRESKNKEFQSAYKKDQFFNYIDIDELGIVGDIQIDKRYHGGIDKAIHIGSNLHFKRFFEQNETKLDKLAFGCNVFIDKYDEKDINAGDIYTIGDVEVQVTQPRQPCWKIGALFGKMASRYIVKNYATGWYVRILKNGLLDIKNPMVLKERLRDLSIHDMARYLHIAPTDEKIIEKILSYEFIAQVYKDDLLNILKR